MKHMIRRVFELLRGPTMPPEEIEERVEVLESKVRANKIAIERHESNQEVHLSPPQGDA